MQSTMRSLKRGKVKILFNPDTDKTEHYNLSCRGVWLRGGERLGLKQVVAREDKYRLRYLELQEIEKAKALAAEQPKITEILQP